MTGSFLVAPRAELPDDPHRRAVVRLDDGSDVAYRDVRRFGTWLVLEADELDAYLAARLGEEPLGTRFTARQLAEPARGRASARSRPPCSTSGRSPGSGTSTRTRRSGTRASTRCGRRAARRGRDRRRPRGIRRALRVGIRRQGATLSDYRTPNGGRGSMQDEFKVYGREGEPCPRCGAPIAKTRVARARHVVLPGLPAMTPQLPEGVRIGHWTDRDGWTGCTRLPAPRRAASRRARCEAARRARSAPTSCSRRAPVRAPTRSCSRAAARSASPPWTASSRWLAERGIGFETPAALVPLVGAAVVYDLGLGDAAARPGTEAGSRRATPRPRRSSVAASARGRVAPSGSCSAPRTGRRAASVSRAAELPGGGLVSAMAVVNAVGDVLAADGSVLAGIRREGGYVPSEDVIASGTAIRRPWREATTLVCVLTDVVLTKTEAWICARAANAGVARAVSPVWTPFDGDTVFCASTCRARRRPADRLAVRGRGRRGSDPRRSARGDRRAPGCPALSDR